MDEVVPRRGPLGIAGSLAFFFLLTLYSAPAQSPTPADVSNPPNQKNALHSLAFDVVSIKQHEANDGNIRVSATADRLSVNGMPMHLMLREALGVTDDRLLGEPGWANSDRYDLDAKVAPEDAPQFKILKPEQRWSMVLPALEERCALKFHHETRELTVYTLVVAKGGVKMQPSTPQHAEANTDAAKTPAAPGPRQMKAGIGTSGFTATGRAASTDVIAHVLSMAVGSTVIDKTGLAGEYNYTLQFAPDDNMRAGMPPPASAGAAPPPESQGPSIFTAVQEQLGLKLVPQKESTDVIVIDNLARPTAN